MPIVLYLGSLETRNYIRTRLLSPDIFPVRQCLVQVRDGTRANPVPPVHPRKIRASTQQCTVHNPQPGIHNPILGFAVYTLAPPLP